MFGTLEGRRLALSLLLGICIALVTANVDTIFRGAAITPLLADTLNLPGMLFASLWGSPIGGERAGGWRVMFYLGDILAYTFIAFIAISVGNARVRRDGVRRPQKQL